MTLPSTPAAWWCPSTEFELCVTVNHLELQPHATTWQAVWETLSSHRVLSWDLAFQGPGVPTGERLPSPSKPSSLPPAPLVNRCVGWPECGICPSVVNSETDFAGGLPGLIKEG